MRSSSQVSTTSQYSIETPDVDMHDGDESLTSTPLSPIYGPSSSALTPIVVSGLNASKRPKTSQTLSPPPSNSQMDNKMYQFIDSMISKHGEEKYSGYKKKIQDFCKVLASMMEEIAESNFNEYMQESLKTLSNYQGDTYVVLPPTTDITSNVLNYTNMSQIQTGSIQQFQTSSNVVTGSIQQIPTSANSNRQFAIPIASNGAITAPSNVAQVTAPAPPKPPQILTESTSNPRLKLKNNIYKDQNIFSNLASQMQPATKTVAVENSNYVLNTAQSQQSERYSMENQSQDLKQDALHNDAQMY